MRKFSRNLGVKMIKKGNIPTLRISDKGIHLFDLTLVLIRHKPVLLADNVNKDYVMIVNTTGGRTNYLYVTKGVFKGMLFSETPETSELSSYYIITANRENFNEVFDYWFDLKTRIAYFSLPGTPTYKFKFGKPRLLSVIDFSKEVSV